MPIKKTTPQGPKAKLMAQNIPALRKKAKALGVSDYTKRTKENLVQSIMLAEARKKRGTAAGKKATTAVKTAATKRKRTPVASWQYKEGGRMKRGAIVLKGNGIDRTLVDEVIIFAENNYPSYDALIKNYLPNLQKKVLAGKYDPEQAIKLLEYYYANYVRPYMKQPRHYGFDPKLNVEERKVFAKYFRDKLYNEYGLKEIDKKKKAQMKKGI